MRMIVTHHERWQNDFGALFIACSSQIFNDIFVHLLLFYIKLTVNMKYNTMVKVASVRKISDLNFDVRLQVFDCSSLYCFYIGF